MSDEKRSKWISQEIDIEPINKISLKYSELSKKIKKLDNNSKKQLYKEEMAQFYERVDRTQRPIFLELYDLHKRKKNTKKIDPKTTCLEPPIISKFEKFKIDKGEFFTKFFADPFFRECCQQSKEALELLKLVKNEDDFISKLDEIYQKRAVVVMLAAACVEAFINSLGYERFPDLWEGIEKLDIENKLHLYLALNGKPSLYDSCREPYQSLKKLRTEETF